MTSDARLIIVGGGGFGRELLYFAQDCHRAGRMGPVAGYIDDAGPDALVQLGYDLPWLGAIQDFMPGPQDLLVLGIASPATKRRIVDQLKTRGGVFTQLIHPTAITSGRADIGEGVVLCPFAGAGTDTRIGRFATINSYTGLGHDSQVGDFATLSSHVDVTGYAVIGDDVFVGSQAAVLPNVRVGAGAKVGAGATVYRSVSPGATVYVPPAKLLKNG
jgi:sugar O-acyltransferase (sialic acid O-acetyltransferase NeuD family)